MKKTVMFSCLMLMFSGFQLSAQSDETPAPPPPRSDEPTNTITNPEPVETQVAKTTSSTAADVTWCDAIKKVLQNSVGEFSSFKTGDHVKNYVEDYWNTSYLFPTATWAKIVGPIFFNGNYSYLANLGSFDSYTGAYDAYRASFEKINNCYVQIGTKNPGFTFAGNLEPENTTGAPTSTTFRVVETETPWHKAVVRLNVVHLESVNGKPESWDLRIEIWR